MRQTMGIRRSSLHVASVIYRSELGWCRSPCYPTVDNDNHCTTRFNPVTLCNMSCEKRDRTHREELSVNMRKRRSDVSVSVRVKTG